MTPPDLDQRQRVAVARLMLGLARADRFRFDPGQPRDHEGRWTDGDTGGIADSIVRGLREVVAFDAEDDRDTSWLEGRADALERAIRDEDQAEVDTLVSSLRGTLEQARRVRKMDADDGPQDGVTRGHGGFRKLRLQQKRTLAGDLTADQVDNGLEQYVSNPRGYKAINQVARELHGTPYSAMTAAQKKRVKQLDLITSIFNNDATTLSEEVEVWRGVRNPGGFLGALTPGVEFVDDAPTSTSLDRVWAEQFATDFGTDKNADQNALFRIRVKPGQKLVIPQAAMGNTSKAGVGVSMESEAVLPPGTRYRVVARGEDATVGKKKVPTYDIEVVETPVRPPRAVSARSAK